MEKNAIVVLYYNKVSLTRRCLDSILACGYHPDQIICFNNGSKAEFFLQIKAAYPGLSHHSLAENRGFSGGFNAGLEIAFKQNFQGVLFLTNDTTITAQCLENCAGQALATGAGLVAPRVVYSFKPGEIDSIGGYFNQEDISLHHYQTPGLPDLLDPARDYIPGTAVYVLKAAFEELNGVDEAYHMYWEDVDLSFRGHQKGIKQARCYGAKILHGVGRTCHKKPIYTTFYYHRNRIRFCEKFLQGRDLIRAKKKILSDLEDHWRKHGAKKDLVRRNYTGELIRYLREN